MLTGHQWRDLATEAVSAASIVHSLMPPYDWHPDFVDKGLSEFPTAQKAFYAVFNNRWYRLVVYATGYIALNARSTVWKYVSISNQKGPNLSVAVANGVARVPDSEQARPN